MRVQWWERDLRKAFELKRGPKVKAQRKKITWLPSSVAAL